ncbi:hypothetical protein A0H81_09650 [Grifola frondosa]|uniref:Uncharacterized protein n=1 Tax=Grifola frondosa TaxID=5627 RepID=A0A1C7M1A3_GRIFR|nr:hypothetical protein A0H81_09650 [Grifola frondosa]
MKLEKLPASQDMLTSSLLRDLDAAYISTIRTLDTKQFEQNAVLSEEIEVYKKKVMAAIDNFIKSMNTRKE